MSNTQERNRVDTVTSDFLSDDQNEGQFLSVPYRAYNLREKSKYPQQVGDIITRLLSGDIIPTYDSISGILKDHFSNKDLLIISSPPEGSYSYRRKTWVGLNEVVSPNKVLSKLISVPEKNIADVIEDIPSNYHKFPLKKGDGKSRIINAPNSELKVIQKRILRNFIYKGWATNFAHGFNVNKSTVTNGKQHLGKRTVVKMDMYKFFDHVTRDMVKTALVGLMGKDKTYCIDIVADLCTLKGVTPQGAPTSPALSNVVCRYLDFSLAGLAQRFNAVYTRYADDIVFSSDDNDLHQIIPIARKIVEEFGFFINNKKTGVFKRGGRQTVTGIVVNDIANVRRKKRMNFRAKLHNIIIGKTAIGEVDFPQIKGYASYIYMVNQQQGERFMEDIKIIEAMIEEQHQPFLGEAVKV